MANFDMTKAALITAMVAGIAALSAAAPAWANPEFAITPVESYEIDGELLLNPNSVIRWDPVGPNKRARIVDSDGVPGGQAIEIEVKRKSREPWDVRMRAPFDNDIAEGDEIALYFWMRASKLQKGYDSGKVDAVIGRNVEPYDTIIVEEIQPTSTWTMYKVTGTAGRNFSASQSDMGFNLGKAKQTIEFGPFFAVRLPKAAAEPDMMPGE